MPNNNILVIDDGTKEYTLKNKYDEVICTIRIRPSEIGLIDRYNDLMRNIEDIMAPLAKVSLNADGSAQFENDWQIVKNVESRMIDEINKLFDFHEAAEIFKTRSMFSAIGGEFFVEKVLTAFGNVIRQGMEEEAKKTEKRLSKYTKDLDKDKRG